MPKPAQSDVILSDFPGIFTDIDPRDLPPGAAEEQVNICSMVTGELRVRLGLQEVTFDP
jgi:hypothetical protein